MDPDANLRRQLAVARVAVNADVDKDTLLDLAELVRALNAWITRGGALPARW